MQLVRRTAASTAVAAFIPLLVFATLEAGSVFRGARTAAEQDALLRAREVNARVDGELNADIGAMSVLATARGFLQGDLAEAQRRTSGVFEARPQWRNVLLTRGDTGEIVWDMLDEVDEPRPAPQSVLDALKSDDVVYVGGVTEQGPGCPCVSLHRRVVVDDDLYVLTLLRGVSDVQSIMMSATRAGEVSGVVDRDGLFLGRSVDYADRLGSPATEYVRAAVAEGGEGYYAGVTYEGFRNRTAYATSALTGWSTHIAVASQPLRLLQLGSVGFTILAGAVALVFAVMFSLVGYVELRRRRLAELAAVQSQKMEAIGHLAGGVAHDFNNLLAALISCLNQLKSTVGPKEAALIDHGLEAADRGVALTRQLLTFARAKPLEVSRVDLRATIEGVRDLLQRSIGDRITLTIDVPHDAQFALTNAAQLELCLVNLAVNARDAMPDGGALRITTRRSPQRRFVELSVADTGAGMTAEVAAQALTPYFTTKPEGQGTGLGLAQVQTFVNACGGGVLIRSEIGQGAEVVLRLRAAPS